MSSAPIGVQITGNVHSRQLLSLAMTEESEETTFYRWVSRAELEDIRDSDCLRPGPNSYSTGKLVTNSPEHAMGWGKAFDEYPNSGSVIAITVSEEMVAEFTYIGDNIDNIGPAWLAPLDALKGATIDEY